MSNRQAASSAFLERAGWGDALRQPLAGDASTRRYERLIRGPARAVLMDAPPDAEAPASPVGATPRERRELGYNARAALAGPDSTPFVAVAKVLEDQGLSSPHVMADDLRAGFLLLEDLGDDLFRRVIEDGADERLLYQAAVEVLVALHQAPPPPTIQLSVGREYTFKDYDLEALQAEVELLVDWFFPLAAGYAITNAGRRAYLDAWSPVLSQTAGDSSVLVLRDYHAENLVWLPDRGGPARVGLLDFQDAVIGSPAYDLVSLLEDARREVDAALASAMLDHYCEAMGSTTGDFDEELLRRDFAILGAQRNAKIIGIFARLFKRDGKPAYLKLLPRVWRYMEHDLCHPDLAGVRAWFDEYIPEAHRGNPV